MDIWLGMVHTRSHIPVNTAAHHPGMGAPQYYSPRGRMFCDACYVLRMLCVTAQRGDQDGMADQGGGFGRSYHRSR